jgi:ribonucleoside-diphosphate reductase alpha chain
MFEEQEVREATMEYTGGDELATDVFVSKYALRDMEQNLLEKTPDDMHIRLTNEFGRIEHKFGDNNLEGHIGMLTEPEIYDSLKDFRHVVPQGSPMYGIGNPRMVSLSNCVVAASPEDNISSIFDTGKNLANLFKRRCGVGADLSLLRPMDALVSNSAGTSTGAWSFADYYSEVSRKIGQNGRRAALMISLDIRHPDAFEFATMKKDLSKVTGANVSFRIYDDFMEAVRDDTDYTLHWPCGDPNPTHTKIIRARDLWDTIIKSATGVAEPGLLMWENILRRLPSHCYPEFFTITVNPCGEIALSAFDSCRLISQNLKWLVLDPFTENARIDFDALERYTRIAMRLSDDLVELEIERLQAIIEKCSEQDEKELWGHLLEAAQRGRRTGLGTHGLADCLARLGVPYDSDRALEVVDKIYETIKIAAYDESCNLAVERGPFPAWDHELEKDNEYILDLPQWLQDKMAKTGRRNIALLTNAPTGSVSIMSQTGSGIEPFYRLIMMRRKKRNHNEIWLESDFVDTMGDHWEVYEVRMCTYDEYISMKDVIPLTDDNNFFVTADQINWVRRVELQATIQKHIDHAISSTINLPRGITEEVVSELYMKGWELGLKGITVYVDGSRDGVLLEKDEDGEQFAQRTVAIRPEELPCDIHQVRVKGEKYTIFVGLLDGKPYEVMGGLADKIYLPKEIVVGSLGKTSFKTRAARYDLSFNGEGLIRDIVKTFDNPEYSVHTRMVSLALRHGAKPSFVTEQLRKGDRDSNLSSFNKVLARVMKNYINDGEQVTGEKVCPECGSEHLIYQEGCLTCGDCGYAKCG